MSNYLTFPVQISEWSSKINRKRKLLTFSSKKLQPIINLTTRWRPRRGFHLTASAWVSVCLCVCVCVLFPMVQLFVCLCLCYLFYLCVCVRVRARLPTPTVMLVGTPRATWTPTHTFKKQHTIKTNKPPYMPIKKQREMEREREVKDKEAELFWSHCEWLQKSFD